MRGEQQKTRLAGVQDSTQESLVFQDKSLHCFLQAKQSLCRVSNKKVAG